MRYSFVTTVRNRPEMLSTCLHSMLWQRFEDYEVIVVDYGSEPPVQVPHGVRLIWWEADEWNESVAKNIGIANASGERLFLLNCDSIIAPDLLGIVDDLLEEDGERHVYWQRFGLSLEGLAAVRALEWVQIRGCFERDSSSEWMQQGWGEWHALHTFGDVTVVEREAVVALGGYDERMAGWGYMDRDLVTRLETLGYRTHWGKEFKLIHCYHERRQEAIRDGHSCEKNQAMGRRDTREGKMVRNGGASNFLQYRKE